MVIWPKVSGILLLALLTADPALAVKLPSEFPVKPDAPTWELADLTGQAYTLEDYRGKWVLMHFWATWCGPCITELPSLDRLQQQMGGRLEILAVNVGESVGIITGTTDQLNIDLRVMRDENSQVSGEWQVQGLPTTYLVDPDGRIFGGVTGTREWDNPTLKDWILEKNNVTDLSED